MLIKQVEKMGRVKIFLVLVTVLLRIEYNCYGISEYKQKISAQKNLRN